MVVIDDEDPADTILTEGFGCFAGVQAEGRASLEAEEPWEEARTTWFCRPTNVVDAEVVTTDILANESKVPR